MKERKYNSSKREVYRRHYDLWTATHAGNTQGIYFPKIRQFIFWVLNCFAFLATSKQTPDKFQSVLTATQQ